MAKLPLDVQQALQRQAPRLLKNNFKKEVDKKFKKIKNEMIKEFLQLPVTQELLQGPDGSNISGTLGGVTNLFAFIGFDKGDQPIAPILQLLENTSIEYSKELRQIKNIGISYNVNLPTSEQIFAITPMPWAVGRSWAKGIETGISGLGYLLRKNSRGRSGAAIQSRVKVRGGRFKNTAYISAFINKYKKKFRDLK
tara:strand:- start:828 stop:1415 length:588 start_codon:yes stop_codon:yes gene_type:complete